MHYKLDRQRTLEQAAYDSFLDRELILCGILNLVGDLTQRQKTLRQILLVEWPVRGLSGDVAVCEWHETAMFLLMQAFHVSYMYGKQGGIEDADHASH